MTDGVGTGGSTEARPFGVRQAAFIGVGAMVGAGIFSLLGAAGEVAGSAVWLSFVLAGIIAALQGYSFAKLGARYPTAGGLLEYLSQAFGPGHVATVTAWLTVAVNVIITAMVAVSFGSYASSAIGGGSFAVHAFAVVLVIAMTLLNVAGSTLVARVQSVIVVVVIGILGFFAVVTVLNMDPTLLAPSTYPSARDIVSSVALTFFAYLGFGVITFTARDLPDASRQLPKAFALAIGIATVIYIGVSVGVFGTLPVDEVIASGATAIAVAAEPVLGDVGFWLILVTALFATAGATNAGLYPAPGLGAHLAGNGQFPPIMGRAVLGGRVSFTLLVSAIGVAVIAGLFDLSAIASIGSAVALLIFSLVTAGHLRIRAATGAKVGILVLALATSLIALLTFVFTTLIQEPASIATLVAILAASVALDLGWTRIRDRNEPRARPATT
jgi:amino acid transporter